MKKHRKLIVLLSVIILALLILAAFRVWDAFLLEQATKNDLHPLVSVVKAKAAPAFETIVLPGTLRAWHGVPIYARTKGYIKNWYVDIGSKVNKGDLLALIETPELDAQLRQAKADLKIAEAQNQLAETTAKRWLNLRKSDSVSQQATDEKVDKAKALLATVASRRANRDRLQQLVDFERVIAPFAGIISDRRTDIGALINIGSGPNEQQPLFRMVQIDPLRLYIKIPQAYSSRIKANMQVSLHFAEHPGQAFPARLLETAHAIDPKTRTLLAQFLVENKAGRLLPGSYAQVNFGLAAFPNSVSLPINVLIFRKDGLQIASLSPDHKVILKNISVHKDLGDTVEVASGLQPGEPVIINPSDAIYAGQTVRIVEQKALL